MARIDVVCLRPKEDFLKVGVEPPQELATTYMSPTDARLRENMTGARALVIPAVGPKLQAELFEDGHIELVQVTGAGIDRLDAEAMQRMGIAVANVPGGSSSAIAEYVMSTALLLLRRLKWADSEIRKGNYAGARAELVNNTLNGLESLTVGVIGTGVIGTTVARAFHSMGCRIVYHDPAPRDPDLLESISARGMQLPDLLTESDIVTLHIPLLPSTRSLIGAAQISSMKPGAILINAARGGIVDEAALADSLASGHLGGAAVDVFSSEPISDDNPLIRKEKEIGQRILLTPHIAGVTRQSWATLFRDAWRNVQRVLLDGEPPINRVV